MTAFFSSRWAEVHEAVTEAPDRTLPQGFRAAGVAAGLKPSGAADLGLLVCDASEATSAARFTRSGVLAAPVLVCRRHARLDALRAVVANSGSANCATGGRGMDDAVKMQGAAAMAARVDPAQVAVASTGVIGVPIDTGKVMRGLSALAGTLRPEGGDELADAIR
ncbi:MAG TPA: bifunctional ornithine acetyltransferase/N-acetylglutamate synthase, partial [Solirubrobacteraceae bacterium]|nr:bifunctional ornithine acetyltransferase/N-acetylglutamate synthase [Solirubrobacteraceae bacterium]